VLQLPFYTLWNMGTAGEIAYAVIHCTGGDVLIGVFAALISTSVLRSGLFQGRGPWQFPVLFIALGLAYTIFSEWLNVSVVKSWTYSDLMPLIPPLGTGLTPILQWIIVPLLTWASADQVVRQLLSASRTRQGVSP
jgi:hypothetical protein